MDAFAIINVDDIEDVAARYGYSETHEARFATKGLGCDQTAISFHAIRPGRRQPFGHRHERQEELYLVASGSGRIKLDDEICELKARDVVRVAPTVTRCIEAGSNGIEIVAFGCPAVSDHANDAEIVPDFWPVEEGQ